MFVWNIFLWLSDLFLNNLNLFTCCTLTLLISGKYVNDCREAGLALAQCIVLEVWVQIRLRNSGLRSSSGNHFLVPTYCLYGKDYNYWRSPNLIWMDAHWITCSPNAWLKVVAREGDSESLYNCMQFPSRGIVIVCLSSLWCMPTQLVAIMLPIKSCYSAHGSQYASKTFSWPRVKGGSAMLL